MAYQALYRKYRSHCFSDFVDQDSIKRILVNSLINGKVSHAYLFSGPRGVGKTSLAKIFAKAVNCLHFSETGDVCEKCINCCECNDKPVDIIEIDAASNNGVDQIRDLKNKVNIVPSSLKYKVYIIDEVHMLTNSAFNALLKTLEEPPSHIIFILATTEFYEVPETIISRCQCFNFSRISFDNIKKRLKYIAKNENIKIKDDVIDEIAHYSNGGLRDAIGMMDKLNSFTDSTITLKDFKTINGLISYEDVVKFYNYIFEGNYCEIIGLISKIENSGYDFKDFVERLMSYTRDKIVNYYTLDEKIEYGIGDNIDLIANLNEILNMLKETLDPLVIMQVYILKFVSKLHSNNTIIISQEIKCDTNNGISKNIENSDVNVNDKVISREINDTNNNKLDDNAINFDVKSKKKNISQEINKNNDSIAQPIIHNVIHVDDNIKNIRINNALATADMKIKKQLLVRWQGLSEYFLNDTYGKVAQLLPDATLAIAGKNNLVLTCETDGMIEKIYTNLEMVEKFLTYLRDANEQKVVVLKPDEFDLVKEKYKNDIKNKVIYTILEEKGLFITKSVDNLIDKAINIFGEDFVEIEEEK